MALDSWRFLSFNRLCPIPVLAPTILVCAFCASDDVPTPSWLSAVERLGPTDMITGRLPTEAPTPLQVSMQLKKVPESL